MARFIMFLMLFGACPAFAQGAAEATESELACLVSRWIDSGIPVVDTKAGGYSAENAAGLAMLSTLAYERPDFVAPLARGLGFTKVKHLHYTRNDLSASTVLGLIWKGLDENQRLIVADTKGYWLENDDLIVVAFAGTDPRNILNLITDAHKTMVPMADMGSVHAGFYGAALIVWRDLYDEYKKTGKAKPMVFTGHSLGAGIATIAAMHFLRDETRAVNRELRMNVMADSIKWDEPYVAGLYTFGSPQVGDARFRAVAGQLFFHPRDIRVPSRESVARVAPEPAFSARLINQSDIVTKVPGTGSFFHIWNPFHLGDDGMLKSLGGFPLGSPADAPLFDSVFDLSARIQEGLKFHRIGNYLRKVFELSKPSSQAGVCRL